MKIDLNQLTTESVEDAQRVARVHGLSGRIPQLAYHQMWSKLYRYSVPELRQSLTLRETSDERARLGRPLRKADLVRLLVGKCGFDTP